MFFSRYILSFGWFSLLSLAYILSCEFEVYLIRHVNSQVLYTVINICSCLVFITVSTVYLYVYFSPFQILFQLYCYCVLQALCYCVLKAMCYCVLQAICYCVLEDGAMRRRKTVNTLST